ncbi:MAG: pilus assembly PilX N-terminal domain-containing protein [Rubrivivax sp.]
MNQRKSSPVRRHERGVATLVVVMVLFFIISMVAAYTSRNLIFEQRTAANQYRSTQALEAAEAGLEWAKAMLNHGRITPTPASSSQPQACLASTNAADSSFRQRYLQPVLVGGVFGGQYTTRGYGSTGFKPQPSCVFNGSGWNCDCPETTAAAISTSGSEIRPAFRVRFNPGYLSALPNGMIRIEAIGCTRLDGSCLDFNAMGLINEGRTIVTQLVALTGGLPSPPVAALTAGGTVALPSAVLRNGDTASGGWTVQSRGAATIPDTQLFTLPGTPGAMSKAENDTSLPNTGDRMFTTVFNMFPDTYRDQPAVVRLDNSVSGCSAAGCTATALANAATFNPGRVIWVEGDLDIDSGTPIGSASDPVLIVVNNGNLVFSGGTPGTINGLVYVRRATWTTAGTGSVQGAVVAQGNVGGNGALTVNYDPEVLRTLRLSAGSFVAVPGGWKDFCSTPTGAMAGTGIQC